MEFNDMKKDYGISLSDIDALADSVSNHNLYAPYEDITMTESEYEDALTDFSSYDYITFREYIENNFEKAKNYSDFIKQKQISRLFSKIKQYLTKNKLSEIELSDLKNLIEKICYEHDIDEVIELEGTDLYSNKRL